MSQPHAPGDPTAAFRPQAMGQQGLSHSDAELLSKMRRRWLLWSIVPVLAALVTIGFVLYTLAWNGLGSQKYNAQDYAGASSNFGKNTGWKPAQQWVAHFNEGTSTLAGGGYLRAIELLGSAKEKAPKLDPEVDYSQLEESQMPPVCMINANLSIAWALSGNDAFDEGQPFLEEFRAVLASMTTAKTPTAYADLLGSLQPIADDGIAKFTKAKEAYDKALEIRNEFKCPDPHGAAEALAEASQKAQDAIDELSNPQLPPPPQEQQEEEQEPEPDQGEGNEGEQGQGEQGEGGQDEQESPAEPDDNPGESSGGGGNLTPDEQARQDLLHEQNKAGQRERDATEGYMGGYEYTPKQW